MPKRFWFLAAAWTLLIGALTPVLIEALDRRGWSLLIPRLSVTASELVSATLVVLAGVAALCLLLRPRRL